MKERTTLMKTTELAAFSTKQNLLGQNKERQMICHRQGLLQAKAEPWQERALQGR
jgi:hypothetical protein